MPLPRTISLQSGATYRKQCHSSNQLTRKLNSLGIFGKVAFIFRIMAQLPTTAQALMESFPLQTAIFLNRGMKLIGYDGRISQA